MGDIHNVIEEYSRMKRKVGYYYYHSPNLALPYFALASYIPEVRGSKSLF